MIAPASLNEDRYDIDTVVPPDATEDQFRQMLQNLLTERFKLSVQ